MAKAKNLPNENWRSQVYDYTDTNGKTIVSHKEKEPL